MAACGPCLRVCVCADTSKRMAEFLFATLRQVTSSNVILDEELLKSTNPNAVNSIANAALPIVAQRLDSAKLGCVVVRVCPRAWPGGLRAEGAAAAPHLLTHALCWQGSALLRVSLTSRACARVPMRVP